MYSRNFSDLADERLVSRGNKIMNDLFSKSVRSVRQLCDDEASAKGCYRFLQNSRVGEEDIVRNMMHNCVQACRNKYVVCIQDTTEINLYNHRGRIKKDSYIGTTANLRERGLGFYIHPSLILDAASGTPYGFAHVKLWSRNGEFQNKNDRGYRNLPIEEKESYKWLEVSERTISALSGTVPGMVIIQDREGDIYEQFARIPQPNIDLLVRARADRITAGEARLFDSVATAAAQGAYQIVIEARNGRKKRIAQVEVRYKAVEVNNPRPKANSAPPSLKLWVIEARETGYNGADAICWRLLTTIGIKDVQSALLCIEWYSWRWTVEEVFKILKKEGYHIEASELEYAASIRKQSLMIMEVCIKLFLMRLAYAQPESEISADSCFDTQQQQVMEVYIIKLQGKTQKQRNPYNASDLKRYVWVLARLGGWKGYESYDHPGITTLWRGMGRLTDAVEGFLLFKDVSTR